MDGCVALDGSKYAVEGCGRESEDTDIYLTRASDRKEPLVAVRPSIFANEFGGQTEREPIKPGRMNIWISPSRHLTTPLVSV